LQKVLIIFPWQMGVQHPRKCKEKFSSSFEPPYLKEK
jgi:hypothetical protein